MINESPLRLVTTLCTRRRGVTLQVRGLGRVNIPYAGHGGRNATHQDCHKPDDHEAAVPMSPRRAAPPSKLMLPY
jgi:hypothetical protein